MKPCVRCGGRMMGEDDWDEAGNWVVVLKCQACGREPVMRAHEEPAKREAVHKGKVAS